MNTKRVNKNMLNHIQVTLTKSLRLVPKIHGVKRDMPLRGSPTNQENWPSVGTIESTLAQYSAIYGNTLGKFSWFVGRDVVRKLSI